MNSTTIAIAGGSGAGKTWLARQLRRRLFPYASILPLDDFHHDLSHLPLAQRALMSLDHPDAIEWPLFESVLAGIQRGGPVLVPRYDFASRTRAKTQRRWLPRPIVLVEGLWPWWQPGLSRFYLVKIFRAGTEAGRFIRRERAQPMHARFVHSQLAGADLVLEPRLTSAQIDGLASQIRGRVHAAAA